MFERRDLRWCDCRAQQCGCQKDSGLIARGEEQKSGAITDKRELRPMVGELDYQGNCASPIDSVSEVPI